MDSATFGALLEPFLSLVVFNVVVVVTSLILCTKAAPKELTAPVVQPAAPDGDAKGEVKEKSKKEQSKKEKEKSKKEQSKKETSKKNGSVKKSVKEQKSKKETSKKEKEKSVKKEVKEDEKPVSPIGDDGKKNGEPEKAEEKKEGQENADKKEEEKKEDEKKPEEKKEEDKKNDEAGPSKSPAAQTATQLVKKVAVEPAELRFSQTGGTSKLTVTNNTGARIAVKIKCSDNNLFRVNPVFSFVEKDGKCDIEVSRTTGNVKPDKLCIATTEVADDAKDAPAVFKDLAADKLTTTNVAMYVN